MRHTSLFSLTAIFTMALPAIAPAQLLFDDFNDGSINSALWSQFNPSFGNAGLSESAGNLRFLNGSAITSLGLFPASSIEGRFRFTGWEYDRFKVLFRSDGTTIDSNWQTRIGGLGVQFTSSQNPDYGPTQTLQLWDFRTATILATAAPVIDMNTFYTFSIVDSNNVISVFFNDSPMATLSYASTTDYGDHVEFSNREQAAGSAPPPYHVDLDYVQVVPEPSTYTLLLLSGAVSLCAYKRRRG